VGDLRFFVDFPVCSDLIAVYMKHDGAWVHNLTCTYVEDHIVPPVAFTMTQAQGQDLMDRLWQAGLRPTEGKGSAGALAATERHLEDMRKLVFDSKSKGE